MGISKLSTSLNALLPQPSASFPKGCLCQVKCPGVESTAPATFTPSDAADEGSASGVPMPTTGSEQPDKTQQGQSTLLVPHLHTSTRPSAQNCPPAMSPPSHPGMTMHPLSCALQTCPQVLTLLNTASNELSPPKPPLIHAYTH